jgi:hypothetical protein
VSKKYGLHTKTVSEIKLLSATHIGSSFMFKTFMLALAFVATPAVSAPYYQAQPEANPATASIVLRDVVWKCGDSGCAGNRSNSRPAIACAVLARAVGRLRSFAEEGRSMSAEELEKCNARAR